MLVVCPSVKNVEMATAIMANAIAHVRLVAKTIESTLGDDPYLESEFLRGWDAEELRDPILFQMFPTVFQESKLFLIFDFRLDGTVGSITSMTRDQLCGGNL
jgi:hypothetical protein